MPSSKQQEQQQQVSKEYDVVETRKQKQAEQVAEARKEAADIVSAAEATRESASLMY